MKKDWGEGKGGGDKAILTRALSRSEEAARSMGYCPGTKPRILYTSPLTSTPTSSPV